MIRILFACVALATSAAQAQSSGARLVVRGDDIARHGAVIECPVPKSLFGEATVVELSSKSLEKTLLGQIGPPRLNVNLDPTLSVLTVVLPCSMELKPSTEWSCELRPYTDKSSGFRWMDASQYERDLAWDGVPVLRYVFEPPDRSSPQRWDDTFKPYHHLYSPNGDLLVTKGTGGLYPHHRGLSYAFNGIKYGDKHADIWHCREGEYQSHVEWISEETGPVYGRHRVRIDWHGRDAAVFATEYRELTAFAVSGGRLIEFRSRLTTNVPRVRLDGDPQHAGFQFRAAQHVADVTKAETYYLRPDGQDQPGSFRNWSAAEDEIELNRRHVDLPWNAVSFVIDGRRFTCAYLDHPSNPKPARFSERDYGRFGSYFEFDLTPDRPLDVAYRVWLQDAEMDVDGVQRLSSDFARPLQAWLESE